MNILITGGNGYIASSLKNNLPYNVCSISRADFDLSDSDLTNNWFKDKFFDVVIHTAICGGSRLKLEDDFVYNINMKMYHNLHDNKNHFNKLITFGSGAEIFNPLSPYGKSKVKINKCINETFNFYNLRIFGLFDYNELSTRFIKGNILRYINREPMVIHANKIMDFYYMKDLITLVKAYIVENDLPKTINCSYEEKFTLKYIADYINSLDNHKVPVIIQSNDELQFYCGNSHNLNISEIGLTQGIINTYNYLKSKD